MNPIKLQIIEYCLSLPHTAENFPFDDRIWVAKVYGKIFALMDILNDDIRINLKCDPDKAELLRRDYDCILPGYHMNKRHWNTVVYQKECIDWKMMQELIQHSYELVVKSIPQSKRAKN